MFNRLFGHPQAVQAPRMDLTALADPNFDLKLQESLLTEDQLQKQEFAWVDRPKSLLGKFWCWLRHGSRTRSDLVCREIATRLLNGDYTNFSERDFNQLETNLNKLEDKLMHKKGGVERSWFSMSDTRYAKEQLRNAKATLATRKNEKNGAYAVGLQRHDRALQDDVRRFDMSAFKNAEGRWTFFSQHLVKASLTDNLDDQALNSKPRGARERMWCRMWHGDVFRKDRLAEAIALRIKHGNYEDFTSADYQEVIDFIEGRNEFNGLKKLLDKHESRHVFESDEEKYVNKALGEAVAFLEAKKQAKQLEEGVVVAQHVVEEVVEVVEDMGNGVVNAAELFIDGVRDLVGAVEGELHERGVIFSEKHAEREEQQKPPANEHLADIQRKAHQPSQEEIANEGFVAGSQRRAREFKEQYPNLELAQDPVPPPDEEQKSFLDTLFRPSSPQEEEAEKVAEVSDEIFSGFSFFGKKEGIESPAPLNPFDVEETKEERIFDRFQSLLSPFEKNEPEQREKVEERSRFSLPSVSSLFSFNVFSKETSEVVAPFVVEEEPALNESFVAMPTTIQRKAHQPSQEEIANEGFFAGLQRRPREFKEQHLNLELAQDPVPPPDEKQKSFLDTLFRPSSPQEEEAEKVSDAIFSGFSFFGKKEEIEREAPLNPFDVEEIQEDEKGVLDRFQSLLSPFEKNEPEQREKVETEQPLEVVAPSVVEDKREPEIPDQFVPMPNSLEEAQEDLHQAPFKLVAMEREQAWLRDNRIPQPEDMVQDFTSPAELPQQEEVPPPVPASTNLRDYTPLWFFN